MTLATRPSTSASSALFLLALAINFTMTPATSATSSGASFIAKVRSVALPAAALGADGGADGGRRRLPLRPGRARGDRPVRRRPDHLPVPARRPAPLPAARRRAGAAHQPAGQLPGRDVERAAAHARPARPDDRPALGGGGALLAGDRPAGRLLAPGGGARPHRRAAARHRQVHPPRPDPEGERAAHRRGLDADQAPPAAGRPRRLLARRLRPGRRDHPRPPRADRRQRLSARPRRATKSRSWRGSSRSPTPTT